MKYFSDFLLYYLKRNYVAIHKNNITDQKTEEKLSFKMTLTEKIHLRQLKWTSPGDF